MKLSLIELNFSKSTSLATGLLKELLLFCYIFFNYRIKLKVFKHFGVIIVFKGLGVNSIYEKLMLENTSMSGLLSVSQRKNMITNELLLFLVMLGAVLTLCRV